MASLLSQALAVSVQLDKFPKHELQVYVVVLQVGEQDNVEDGAAAATGASASAAAAPSSSSAAEAKEPQPRSKSSAAALAAAASKKAPSRSNPFRSPVFPRFSDLLVVGS